MEGKQATPGKFKQRFDGYGADHYRVHLEGLKEQLDQYGSAFVEIQVASLLTHAWSEVNHDLGYKPIHEMASLDELRIFDGLNGLALTGEVLLQQLQAAAEARVSSANQKFANQHKLEAFLENHLATNTPKTALMGRLDILFEVLKVKNLDSPKALDPKLNEWKKRRASDSSITVSLMDFIFRHESENSRTAKESRWL